MAANEYYNSGHSTGDRPPDHLTSTPHPIHDSFAPYDSYNLHTPPSYPSPAREDSFRTYEHSSHTPSTSYYAPGGGGRDQEQNPFSDDIPLRAQQSKNSSDARFQDHLPYDPTVLDAPPDEGAKRRPRRKKGIFSRRIPWVVYAFTTIQCAVFIAELVKNGNFNICPDDCR